MRRSKTAFSLVLLAAVGCSNDTGVEPPVGPALDPMVTPPETTFVPRVGVTELGRLDIDRELHGRPVSEAESGAWLVRSTRTGAEREGLEAETKLRRAATGGAPRPGAPPPPASAPAPEPTESGGGGGGDGDGGDGGVAGGGYLGAGSGAAPAAGGEPVAMDDMESGDDDIAMDGVEMDAPFSADGRRRRPSKIGPADAPAQQLKAGSTDDNADFAEFVEFLDTWVARKDIRQLYHPLDVRDRRFLRVVDEAGRPVPGAVVSVVDEERDRVVFSGTTYGDGRVPFYPGLVPAAPGGDVLAARSDEVATTYLVEAHAGEAGVRLAWDGAGDEFEITLADAPVLPDPLQLDVLFLIDTTGSMRDEIESIKASLLRVTGNLRSLGREFDLRYGAVLYRDIGDEYLTARHPFTGDIEAFDAALKEVGAAGGGDGPESLNQGLAEAVDRVEWRPEAAKVMFLIADAQPHMDYAGDTPYGESVQAAVGKGIRIHSVAASGLNPVGTLAFRQIAQFTRGKFIFIEYGSTAASAASHGVTGKVKSNNLEDIIFEQIRDELARFGRE